MYILYYFRWYRVCVAEIKIEHTTGKAGIEIIDPNV